MTRDEAKAKLNEVIEWSKFNRYPYVDDREVEAIKVAIKALEQQTCDDCKYNTKPRHAVCNSCICGDRYVKDEESKQQSCDDAVSREDVLMALTGEWTEPTDELIHRFIRRIKNLPPVNPQPICEEREKGECPYYAG